MTAFTAPRRGFSLAPLVLLLALAVAGLTWWKIGIYTSQPALAGHPLATSLTSKFITTHVTAALFVLAAAGGLGALAYFLAGRSLFTANTSAAMVLLLGVGVFGFQVFNYYTRFVPPAGAGSAQSSTPRGNADTPSLVRRSVATPVPARPARPPDPAPVAPPADVTAPLVSSPPPPPDPAPPPTPAVTPRPMPARENAAAKPVLDSLASEIREQAASLARDGAALLDSAKALPKPTKTDLESRRASAGALKSGCTKLSKRLFDLQKEAQSRLEAAGLSHRDAMSASVSMAASAGFGPQFTACHRLEWAADAVLDEVQLLSDALGRWGLKDGRLNTKDPALNGQISGTRFRIENSLKDRDDVLSPLRGD